MRFHELLLLLMVELLILLQSSSCIIIVEDERKESDQNDRISSVDGESTILPVKNNKSLSRSKLWAPYSTVANFLDTIEDGNVTDVSVSTTGSDSKVIGSIVTHFDGAASSNSVTVQDEEVHAKIAPSTPIISSIRHYRSRKSFTRIRKGPITTTIQPPPGNELIVKADTKLDLDGEQGDEPYYQTVSTSSFTSTVTTSRPKGSSRFSKHDSPEDKDSHGGTNNGGQNRGISFRNDTKAVYGKPYFTSARERNSTKIQRIKNFLSRNSTSRTGKEGDLHSESSGASASNPDLHVESTEGKEIRKVNDKSNGGVSLSKTTVKEPRQKSLFSKENENRDEDSSDDKVKVDSGLTDLYSYRASSFPSELTTGIPRIRSGIGKGNKLRGNRGTKRPGRPVILSGPDGQSELSLESSHISKKPLQEHSKKAPDDREIIIDQSRRTSELYGTVRQQPGLDKIDTFRAEFNPSSKNQGLADEDTSRNKEFDIFSESEDGESEAEIKKRGNKTLELFPSTDNSKMNYSDNTEYVHYDNPDEMSSTGTPNEQPGVDAVGKVLREIESKTVNNCRAGTDYNLGEGVVDRYAQERFRQEAEFAVNRANMLTRLWKYTDSHVLSSEYLLHAMVMSIVEFDDDIFAAGNCYDKFQYKNYELYCPFAYRLPEGSILVKDLAVEYKYLSNTSEWFFIARKNAEKVIKNFSQITRGYNTYTHNESAHTERIEDEILNVTYDDGKWSKPYFDCGGGNIWMMTYTVPFFGYKNGTYFFKGTSGIDVDLRRVDIDQCPLPENSTALNIFAASDKCKNATTKCVSIKELGFRRGSYRCVCKEGFYFPNTSSPFKFFNGTLLEEEYDKSFITNLSSDYNREGSFECLKCPDGCDTCTDSSPCVVSLHWLMRTAILILQCAIILMLPIVGLFTWKYSEVKVIRAASPVLLRFIVLGAFFIYCTILVMYPTASVITCTLRVWLREIGFSLAYGALMLKTWRISVIFRVRSAKAVKITDLDLMKRLGIIVAMFTTLLVIRTLVAPPVSIVSLTADDLKAWLCKSDWWDHSFTIMELSFLVWGIRLCIVVRKAPSEFNESKFISLAIYNEFLLSLFLNISMLFLQSPANPDLLYIIFFCHVQLTMTLLLCLIFGSKAYMVFRGQGKGGSDDSRQPTSKFISKNRSGGPTTKQPSGHNSTGLHSSTTSTGPDPNVNSRLSEDVQEEFRRLYFQLEELKERNMRLGNRHLVAKITAMQEAADNILSGGGHRLQASSSSTNSESAFGTSPNSRGKNVALSDISEEENPYQSKSSGQSKSLLKPVAAIALVSGSVGTVQATVSSSTLLDGKGASSKSAKNNRSNSCVPKSESKSSRVGNGGGEDSGSHLNEEESPSENEVHVGDDEIDLDVDEDMDIDLVESEAVSPAGEPSSSHVNFIDGDCSNEQGCESIPMKTITKSRHPNRRPNKSHRSGIDENFPTSSKSISESQSGKRISSSKSHTQQRKQQQQTEKNLNHTGGGSTSSTTKIILDLDDKSRFTEEITV